ncbi:MAG: sulfatase-like hydrolase/transferase, partial [Prevotellaceae bacterium]|nr:sulfatase-like hydrolase/transferase [Prevotellaceae bacterium]
MKTNRILQKYPRLLLFFLSFALFIGYFLIDKVLFMLFHWEQMPENAFSNCIRVLWNGLPMDISMAGYMMLVPGIIMILSLFFTKGLRAVLTAYFLIICTVVNLIVIPDIGLYSFWGFRIDATIFNYITSPKEALASVSVFFILLVITCIAVWTIIQFYLLKKSAAILFPAQNSNKKALSAVAWILLLGLMVIPMRGGLSTATMNISRVYFSDNIFLNHSAINPVFYMLNSFEQEKSLSSQYRFMSDSEAEDIVTGIIAQTAGNDSVKFIVSEKPNIIFIVLESFGAAIIERLGGERGVAPNLNRLIDEGVFFPNMYANSFRTDRGLVSVFAGFPAQPTMSILKYPQKAQALPSIPQSLINHGYSASFLHGGDLNFANIRSFIVSQGITDITMDKDFPVKEL